MALTSRGAEYVAALQRCWQALFYFARHFYFWSNIMVKFYARHFNFWSNVAIYAHCFTFQLNFLVKIYAILAIYAIYAIVAEFYGQI